MRAIIKARTHIDINSLDALLTSRDWWPSLPQESETVQKHKNEILEAIFTEDKPMVEATYLCTIYDDATRSWAIVNNPSKHIIDFRIKNPDSDKLKTASEKLVADLQYLSSHKGKKDKNVDFEFISRIEVFEPESKDHAYYGDILPRRRFSITLQQKRTEFWVGIFAGFAAVFLFIITIPPIANSVLGDLSADWVIYWKGFFDRLATSALVTATVSILNVVLHYLDMRRKPVVNWEV